MKKFDIHYADGHGWIPESLLPIGRPVRRFVPAEQAEALEQFNKEMLEVLKEAHKNIKTINTIAPLRYYVLEQKIQSIIAKAEEV